MSSASPAQPKVSKPLLIALGVLVIAALVYLLVVLPKQSAPVTDVAEAQAPVAPSEPAVAAETPAGGDSASEQPEQPSFEVFNARDPFDQLVVDADSAAVGGTTDTGATSPTDTTTPAPATPVGGTDPTGSSTPAPNDGQTTVGTTTIALDDVFAEGGVDKVILVVNGEGYEGAEGETVADVTVLDIEGSCATMRYDDTRFILCEGEHVQK
jgi:hypothetical protein